MTVLSVAARRGLGLAAGVVLAGTLLAAPVAAAKPTKCQIVNVATHKHFATLQTAVDAASPRDTLRVKGTCVGSTTINRDVTITGESKHGVGAATLDGNGAGRVLTITGGVVSITGLTITGGSATFGGGLATIEDHVAPQADVTVTRSVITGNTATDGAGIGHEVGPLTLVDTIVSHNTASRNGGGYISADGSLYVSGTTTFSGNHAGLDGGGIFQRAHGNASLSDTTSVDHNTAGRNGGGMYIDDAWVRLNDRASIRGNSAGSDGGGVWGAGAPAQLWLNDRSSISDNTATGDGGGVFLAFMTGVHMAGTSSITRNTATADGGGAWVCADCGVQVRETSAITGNTTGGVGGGVYKVVASYGLVTIEDAGTISDNVPDNCYPPGTITGCTN